MINLTEFCSLRNKKLNITENSKQNQNRLIKLLKQFNLLKPNKQKFLSIMPDFSNTMLEDEQNTVPQDKVSVGKYELKIQHLNHLNKKIYKENQQLKAKIVALQHQNATILDSQIDENSVINNLRQQLQIEKLKNSQLSKQNEQLLATILLNEQMAVQAKIESNMYVVRYQQKILELRQNLQMKQLQVQSIQDKLQRFRSLQLPLNTKNATRFTAELLKYQILIQNLIQERNLIPNKDAQEINHVLSQLTSQDNSTKKNKKDKNNKITMATDVRPNLFSLSNDSPYGNLDQQKLDVIFLRLHFELRSLKKSYKQKLQKIAQFKSKDKIMKQGYNTLTKEIQKVRIQNCQLSIQLEHLSKKLQTTKELSQTRSVGVIQNKRSTYKQNAQQKISSQVSIEANCSSLKPRQKGNLPSQTKHDTLQVTKSHNFDQQIENIEGILSLDSDPDFRDLRNKKGGRHDQNEQQLSVCQQNSVDMSISLDTSGFQAPERSHHEISEHILKGLIDKKVF